MRKRRRAKGKRFELTATADPAIRRNRTETGTSARSLGAEQSNTSWIVDERYVLKLFRKLEDAANPELEISRHLAKRRFAHVPALLGHADLAPVDNSPASTLAVLQTRIAHQGDAWKFTLDEVERFFERALASGPAGHSGSDTTAVFGGYTTLAALLGKRTAELHIALATDEGDAAFTPEPFSPFARRSLYQSLRNLVARVYNVLDVAVQELPDAVRASAGEIVARRDEIMGRFSGLLGEDRIESRRIRIHGDYHLGQVLYVHDDFVIIDFEGEPHAPSASASSSVLRSPTWPACFAPSTTQWKACSPAKWMAREFAVKTSRSCDRGASCGANEYRRRSSTATSLPRSPPVWSPTTGTRSDASSTSTCSKRPSTRSRTSSTTGPTG
ncbi:MAG: phosphotransferase [Rhodobacteraceae bacterium]|nr:phosphotransferase [Paracoccaceae bacterium]